MSRRTLGPKREASDSNDWMTTYSDAITLLLAFFVMLISVAEIDEGKFEELKEGWGQSDKGNSQVESIEAVAEQLVIEGVSVTQHVNHIEIEIANENLYDIGSADLKLSVIPVLEDVAFALLQLDLHGTLISIEGHTDDVPIQSEVFGSNWELSAMRATTMVRKMIDLGIPPSNLQAVGLADTKPKSISSPDFTDEDRKQNRRVTITVNQQ